MIDTKDTDFIKVITGVKRSGKPTLLLMFKDYLLENGIKKDIIDRNNIKEVSLLENIIKYLVNNIGSPISSNKISDYLNSNKVVQKSNHQTIDNYLNMLEKSYIIYKADRTDVKNPTKNFRKILCF